MQTNSKVNKNHLSRLLPKLYDEIVKREYDGNYLLAVQHFEEISEKRLREVLRDYYKTERSLNQAWRARKGNLYEYAVFKALKQVIASDEELNGNLRLTLGNSMEDPIKDQIVIRNWSDILPDVDIIILDKNNCVKAIVSCKTSLRERLTETAFWKRELEKQKKNRCKDHFYNPRQRQ